MLHVVMYCIDMNTVRISDSNALLSSRTDFRFPKDAYTTQELWIVTENS
jgi:hypothetical protein